MNDIGVPDPREVDTRNELVRFLTALRSDLQRNPDGWQNVTLDSYLEAIGAWFVEAREEQIPHEAPWNLLAAALWVGRIYE